MFCSVPKAYRTLICADWGPPTHMRSDVVSTLGAHYRPSVFTASAISDDGSLLVVGSDLGFVDVYKMKYPE